MTMFNNWLAAFDKRTPSPLYGKPLMYLIGSQNARAIPGSVVEPSYGWNIVGDDKIAYLNFFNELYSEQSDDAREQLGPYLHTSDTAEEYDEGQIDPAGPGWDRNLTEQFAHAAGMGFKFAELDNPDAYSIGVVQSAVTKAHEYGLGIIAKNPKLVTNGALQFIAHPNVFGVIVERGAGMPAEYNAWRLQARKDGLLPVWFVFDGHDGDSQQCASQILAGGFKGMGVTYSTGREKNGYNDSHTVLLPVV